MSAARLRGTVRVGRVGRRTMEFAGCRWQVRDAGRALGLRTFMRAPYGVEWHVRDDEANDLIAYLEHAGHRVEMVLFA